jgi:hypothetical protein
MIFVPWSGLLDGAVATGGAVAFAMGSLLIGLLAATAFVLVLGAERKPRRLEPAVASQPRQTTAPRPPEVVRAA